jgi:hypothetical protein
VRNECTIRVCVLRRNVDLYELLDERSRAAHQYTTYDLIANVVHDGKPQSGMGAYRVQILHNVRYLRGGELSSIVKSTEHKQVVRTGRSTREGDTAADHNADGKLYSGTRIASAQRRCVVYRYGD